MDSSNTNDEELPKNRFELELEFLQCLASPAYLHFLATSTDLHELLPFFKYLRKTYRRPEYIRFIRYPNAFYFLELLIERPTIFNKEFTLPEFRNFCHQQQFLAWQHRHASCYGVGKLPPAPTKEDEDGETNDGKDGDTAMDTESEGDSS